jgi:hypothetical protein
MAEDDRERRFEGYARNVTYHSNIEREFSVPITTFRVSDSPNEGLTSMETYAIGGQNRPPILNGHQVCGVATRLKQGNRGVIFVVDRMALKSDTGETLCNYDTPD